MNTRKRFLVLNPSNQAECPAKHGMALPDLQSKGSPSFVKKETAVAFAKLLAKRNKGTNYYVAEVLGGATAYTSLTGIDDPENPVTWADAAEDGAE